MTDFSGHLAAIHAAFADPITYSGPGLTLDPITAVYSNEAADPFPGKGKTARTVAFEIRYADLPRRPGRSDEIAHASGTYRVADVTDRDDIGAWAVAGERTS